MTNGYPGYLSPEGASGEYNAYRSLVKQLLNRANTSTLVKIVAVTNSGGLSPVGFVDVQPLVNQVDGARNKMPHGVLHHLPYFRLQGGTDAIILDPKVGDIGIAVFADHDISTVKATKAQANPGSSRRFAMADGVYIGGVLNGTPAQYIQFTNTGINVVSPTAVTVNAPAVTVNAQTSEVNASMSATVTSPIINLAAAGQTLLAFVTSAFQALFNGHTHNDPSSGVTSVPNQPMTATHLTTTVKGG